MKIDPNKCLHRTVHPNRVDGARTVCLDCEQPVIIQAFAYANGDAVSQQFADVLARCEAASSDEHDALRLLSEMAHHLHTILLGGGTRFNKPNEDKFRARLWRLYHAWQKSPLWGRYLNVQNDVGYIA